MIAGFADAGLELSEDSAGGDIVALGAELLALAEELVSLRMTPEEMGDLEAAINAALAAADVPPGADMVASIEALGEALVEAQADLALVEEEVAAEKAKVAEADRVARAEQLDMALRDADDAPLGGTVPAPFAVKRSNDGGAVTVEVKDSGYDAVTGTPDEHGWTTVTLVDEGSDSTETLMVYTNIDTPTDQKLVDQDGWMGGELPVWDTDTDIDELDASLPASSVIGSLRIAAAALDRPATLTLGDDVEDVVLGGETVMTRSFSGTYEYQKQKVPGTFICSGTCEPLTVTYTPATDDDPEMTVIAGAIAGATDSGDWFFKPSNPKITVKVADESYLAFGTLTTMPEDADDTHMFSTFFDASTDAFTAGIVSELIGTATYDGPAGGRYATTNTIAATAHSGEFVAEAHLRANFDAETLALKESSLEDGGMLPANMIWGEIRNFEEEGESLGAWRVDLGAAAFDDMVFDGVTKLEIGELTVPTAGTWNGGFFGNGDSPTDLKADSDGEFDAEEVADTHPTGVAGEFVAEYDGTAGSAVIVGAFGATRTGK